MIGVKACTTPMSSTQSLQLTNGSPSIDATQFQQVIGALQYLSLNKPNVSFLVIKLARFMHALTEHHWSLAKCVLHHLKDTMYHDLFLKCHQHLHLIVFTNTDKASNHDDCTFTSINIVYLGGNAISWCSKK